MKESITLTVNGVVRQLEVEPRCLLVDVLRKDLGLTGTKQACESNICGACTVLLDGQSIHSCCSLAVQAKDREVTTIEGIGAPDRLHPVQQAFLDHLGYQCGFCTPGMIMSAVALLRENQSPTDEEIQLGLTGNICRCTGYIKIVDSIRAAAQAIQIQEI